MILCVSLLIAVRYVRISVKGKKRTGPALRLPRGLAGWGWFVVVVNLLFILGIGQPIELELFAATNFWIGHRNGGNFFRTCAEYIFNDGL
jgi:hypothetical protein